MKNKTPLLIPAVFLLALACAAPARLSAGSTLDLPGSRDPFSWLSSGLADIVYAAPAAEVFPVGVFDSPADKIYYLSPNQVDISRVPPAPTAGSDVDKEDLAAVRRWQAERTEAQCEAARAQANATYDEFFGAVSPFGNPAPAEVEKIFSQVRTDAGSMVFLLKNKYRRPRPFLRDPAIAPCLCRALGYAYPSGHSTAAHVFGLMLSDLVPANAHKYMSYANQGGLNRVIGGVHYPSDTEAGKTLGDAIYKALKQNCVFNADMDTLRKNLKR